MCSSSRVASVAALLLATAIPINSAWAQATPANVDELRAALKALQQEQQSTDQKIRTLEQRINALDPSGALNSQSRVPDANAALMRGRGLGSIDGDAPAAAPEQASVTPPEDEARKTPATSQVVQAVTENQQGYFGKHISIDPGINYSHFTNARLDLNGFLALDAIFLGLISIDELNADVITT